MPTPSARAALAFALLSGCEMIRMPGEDTAVATGPALLASQPALPASVDPSELLELRCTDLDGDPLAFNVVAIDSERIGLPEARVGWYNWQTDRWEVLARTDHRGVARVELPYPSEVALLDGAHARPLCLKDADTPKAAVFELSTRPVALPVQVVGPGGTPLAEEVAVGALQLVEHKGKWLTTGTPYPLVPDEVSSLLLTPGQRYTLATSHPRFAVECVGLASWGDCSEPRPGEARNTLTVPEELGPDDALVVRLGDLGFIHGQAVSIETGRPIEAARVEGPSSWPRWSDASGQWSLPIWTFTFSPPEVTVPGHTGVRFPSHFPIHLSQDHELTFHEQLRWVHVEGYQHERDRDFFPSCTDGGDYRRSSKSTPILDGGRLVACPAHRPAVLQVGLNPLTAEKIELGTHVDHISDLYPVQ